MIYTFNELDNFLNTIEYKTVFDYKHKQPIEFYNLAASFDIETTSFYYDDNENENIDVDTFLNRAAANSKYTADKRSVMYIWQFAIEDNIIYGRTWLEFLKLNRALNKKLGLCEHRKLVVYVHNLSYEFQFMCKYFYWLDVFATSERKPIYCENNFNIIFKCSYRLSGYSLNTVAKNLRYEKIKKLVGDLDYNLLRNDKTPLTDLELEYCFNDVKIVVAFIRECILDYGNIISIPLTQTGIVRRHVRKNCFNNKRYPLLIKDLTIEPMEYKSLQRAFAGGFTHASALYSGLLCENVTSYDFTSSYPTVLCAELFPMSKGKKIDVKLLNNDNILDYLKKYCCLFDLELTGVKPRFIYENIISRSKCFICENSVVNNGRIVSADRLAITVTELDFKDISQFYSWESMKISNFYIYEKGYLPREIIESILTMYSDKTTLKGVEDKELEYMHAKQMLNSVYGMCVTSIIRDEVGYNSDGWNIAPADLVTEIENYNKDKNRFLFYQWGVWCTAYARHNLYGGILEFKNDYIYSDTDSLKVMNVEKHKNYLATYNKNITAKLFLMCKHYNFDTALIAPATIKGEKKPLGVWDFDGHYKYFKTLGAKRYLTMDDNGDFHLTVAGLNKKTALPFIMDKGENDIKKIFDIFDDGLYIPFNYTGKNTHTYIDNEKSGILTDYMGNKSVYTAKTGVHLQAADYALSLTEFYINYIRNIQNTFDY